MLLPSRFTRVISKFDAAMREVFLIRSCWEQLSRENVCGIKTERKTSMDEQRARELLAVERKRLEGLLQDEKWGGTS
jgi:hypothetical protein